jgi:DNA-binding NarL/FixJ family response regulator
MIKVVLADDEPVVRAGVRAVLSTAPSIEVVGEADNGRTAVDLVVAHRPDVAVLDIRMPVMDGIEAIREMRRVGAACACLVLTTFAEDDYLVSALAEGASGFVLKTGDPREIVDGVIAAGGGAAYLSPQMTQRVLDLYTRNGRERLIARDRLQGLSDRELSVLSLVGAGMSNAEIGRRLHIAESTVKVHVSSILNRVGVRNRVEAALLAYESGLADLR